MRRATYRNERLSRCTKNVRESHLSVKPLTFDDKENITKFLETFEEVADLNRWCSATAAIQLKLVLTGKAIESMQVDHLRRNVKYLQTHYGITEDEVRKNSRQRNSEKEAISANLVFLY